MKKSRTWFSHEVVLLILIVGEWCLFAAIGRRFSSLDNTWDIVRHSAEIGLLALVMTPIILTGGIDLSIGSLLGLAAILFGKLWRDAQMSPLLAGFLTILISSAAGAVNALFITRFKLPPLIVTLGSFSLFRGLAEAITRGVDTFTNFPPRFLALGQERWLGIPEQAFLFCIAAVAIWVFVHQTTFGREFRAIGFSSEGSLYAGIPVARRLALVYILAGFVAGLAAVIYTARLGQAKADAGAGYELLAITAVVLGGASIFGGKGSVHGTLLGVAALAILNNGLVHARQPREVAGMLTGLLLIAALTASTLSEKLAKPRRASHNSAESGAS